MNPKRPWDCADMSQVRAEIDRIDEALVDLIAERFGYVDRAWQLKKNTPEGATVPWRIQQVIDKVKARAKDKELPPDIVDMVGAQWKNMIGWFVQYEEEQLRLAQDKACRHRVKKWVLICKPTSMCSNSSRMPRSIRRRSRPRSTWAARPTRNRKILIAAFAGAIAGVALIYVAALLRIWDAPMLGRAGGGIFVASLVAGVVYGWLGFATQALNGFANAACRFDTRSAHVGYRFAKTCTKYS